MSDFAIGVTVVGVTIIVALVALVCHYLGLWTWTTTWFMSSREEKAQLTKSGHFNANGYMVGSESDFALDASGSYKRYDNLESDFRFLDETKKAEIPPQPLRPAPTAPKEMESSVDTIDQRVPELLSEVDDLSPNMKRAISCDSVSSDTSVALETLEEHANGQLEVGLEYDKDTADLIVSVIQARDLSGPESTIPIDSYIRVFLLPDKLTNMQTRIQRRTSDPMFKERFLFGVEPHETTKRALLFYAYACDKYSNNLIGEVELKLGDIDLSRPSTHWLTLSDNSQRPTELGEIMFSLSYLPTAERLTVVIVKARNLRWTNSKETADPFVKVYLLQNGKKISKKKTSVKKDERNPIFNEAMIFSMPANALQTVQLRVTMAEYQQDGRAPSIGHVIVGSQATGKCLSHWNQMMSSLRKPIAMWHPLRK